VPELCGEYEMKKYVIKGLGDPFNGLVVHTVNGKSIPYGDDPYPRKLIPVYRIENRHALFDSFSLPLKELCLYIDSTCLTLYRETVDDQLTDNPFGEFLCNGELSNGRLNIRWTSHSHAFTVNVRQGDNTLYSHNFMGLDRARLVSSFINKGMLVDYDWDDLLFDLRDLETREIEADIQ